MWPTWQGLRPLPAAKRATGYPATELHKVPHLERPTHLTAIPRHRQVVLTTGQACEAATKPSQLPEAIHCDARTVSPPAASPGLCACAQRPPKAVGVISTCARYLQHPISHPGPGSHRAQTRSVRCSINRRWQGVYPIGQITGQRLPPPPYGRTASAVILSPPFTPPDPCCTIAAAFNDPAWRRTGFVRHGRMSSAILHRDQGRTARWHRCGPGYRAAPRPLEQLPNTDSAATQRPAASKVALSTKAPEAQLAGIAQSLLRFHRFRTIQCLIVILPKC